MTEKQQLYRHIDLDSHSNSTICTWNLFVNSELESLNCLCFLLNTAVTLSLRQKDHNVFLTERIKQIAEQYYMVVLILFKKKKLYTSGKIYTNILMLLISGL